MNNLEARAQFEQIQDLREKLNFAQDICKKLKHQLSGEELFNYYHFIAMNAHFPDLEDLRAEALEWLGNYYYYQSDFEIALDTLYEAVQLLEQKKGSQTWLNCMNNIAVIYNALEQKDKSIEVYENLLQYQPKDTKIFQNYADLLIDKKEYDRAFNYINQGLSLIGKDDVSAYLDMLNTLSNYYMHNNQCEKALDLFNENLWSIDHSATVRTRCFHYINYAEVLKNLGRSDESLPFINIAINIAEEQQMNELLYFSYSIAIDIYEDLEMHKELSIYLRKLLDLKSKLYSFQNARKTQEFQEKARKEKMLADSKEVVDKTKHLASIGIMASGITHEINQPLNAIMIEAQTLLFKDDAENILPESYRQRINYIVEGAERISHIIKHIRSYWIRNDWVDKKEFEVNHTINNAIALISQQIKAHGVFLKIRLSPVSLFIHGTPISLEQTIINLIINSVHALDTIQQKQKIITLSIIHREGNVLIHLEDNGPGIAEEDKEKIFEPFFSNKDKSIGSGLGLTLVQNFVKDLNGQVSIVSEKKKGAHFLVKIPLYRKVER